MRRNILLVYQTSRGSSEQAARWIAEELPQPEIINLKEDSMPSDLSGYDTVIVGSGIIAGNLYGKVKQFVKRHRDELLRKDLCLFITHLEEGEGIEKDFRSAYDEDILNHARHRAGVGGWLDIKKTNFFFRPIIRKIGKDYGIDINNHDTLNRTMCKEFAAKVLSN